MTKQSLIINSLTKEERDFLFFSRPFGYNTRLQQYLLYHEAFAESSSTKTFRHYLRRFIDDFKPEPISLSDNLWLCLERDGRFSVCLGERGDEISNLGESENFVFQFLCFLQLRKFWQGFRRKSRFPAPLLPLFIEDFSDKLKVSADYTALLLQAAELSSQVILL